MGESLADCLPVGFACAIGRWDMVAALMTKPLSMGIRTQAVARLDTGMRTGNGAPVNQSGTAASFLGSEAVAVRGARILMFPSPLPMALARP